MEAAQAQNDSLTLAQKRAVEARGNVLVMAGAGTGKTHTLVQRCLHCLCEEQPRVSLDEILVVTFTEAAAAEMKQRLRRALEEKQQKNPDDSHWIEQLALFDTAHIGTLHSFCLKLVREHFYELGLDPQMAVLDEGETRLLANEILDEELHDCYSGQDEFAELVQKLIQVYGGGRDEKIRSLVLQLHNYSQTRPDAERWLARQIESFNSSKPDQWQDWLLDGIRHWHDEWLPALENLRAGNVKATECAKILKKLPEKCSRKQVASILSQILAANVDYPAGKKMALRKPLEKFFAAAAFLNSLAPVSNNRDPLEEDWNWVRSHMTALLQLTQRFTARFAARKRDDGVLDFHDLEQFALKLLWDFDADKPMAITRQWREKIRFVFVDEYQDINAAQDKIIQALSRDGAAANRFLVGDVKQSIYRFRLADPTIFRDYVKTWHGKNGQTISLAENFRSRERLLQFVNSVFELLMRHEIGGVDYDTDAHLQFGEPEERAVLSAVKEPEPCVELLLRFKTNRENNVEMDNESGMNDLADLVEAEKEARLLALHLKKLKESRHRVWDEALKEFRAVEWRDMAVLLRAPTNKTEAYAKEFERAGVPLAVERAGFYESTEILDLLSLLQLLDNPLQDVPAMAVLHSPFVGCSLDELAQIRLAAPHNHFWTALNRTRISECGLRIETAEKIRKFLDRFAKWRQLARQASLSQCLEEVLAETHYADWLLIQPRGAQRRANVERFLGLAERFDQFQRQGLFRFLKFIEAQRETGVEPEVSAVPDRNAVRLMSIHQSKGQEFPIVAIADLAKPFNTQDLRNEIILDEKLGLCPRVKPPQTGRRYPSLPHWLAQQRQRREQWGEELRLLHVAMTRARETLILTGSVSEKKWEERSTKPGAVTLRDIVEAKSYADWLALWFGVQNSGSKVLERKEGKLALLYWRIVGDMELTGKLEGGKQEEETSEIVLDDSALKKLKSTLSWEYPFRTASERAAKSSVTALRQQAEESDDEAEQPFQVSSFTFSVKPSGNLQSAIRNPQLSAVDAGTAHHRFLQHVALQKTRDAAALEEEAKRLVREKLLLEDESAVLNLENISAFWNSPCGQKILSQREFIQRELAFTAKFNPKEVDEILGREPKLNLDGEFVVIQGIVDLAVLLPGEIWIVDFKTDQIGKDELLEKVKTYKRQLKLYARALARIYARPVTACWLHFLAAQRTEKIGV